MRKTLWLFVLSFSFFVFAGCSPRIKMELWAKRHQDAALELGIWSVSNVNEATNLLEIDCKNPAEFKKRITTALNSSTPSQQSNTVGQYNYHYGNKQSDGFADWCRKYPKAAKKLRSHAKAICKTGLGVLNGSIKIK